MIRKIPKTETIRKNIRKYANHAGFALHQNSVECNYNLFDIHMGYYVHRNIDMDTVVRVITDELYAIKYRMESPIMGA